MKNYETSYKLAQFLLMNYKPESKSDFERADYCERLLDAVKREGYQDAGVMGKVLEVTSRPSTSRLIHVQPSSKADARMTIEGQTYRLEIKSNGGRLGDLERIEEKSKVLIRYTLLIRTPQGKPKKDGTCKPAETRYADVLMRLDEFLELLNDEKVKATKEIEHKNYLTPDKEKAIQADSKKLYEALQSKTKYNRNKVYTRAELGLEL